MNKIKPSDIQPQDAPLDISKKWMNIVRRLRSAARGQRGVAFIKVIVMVDSNGEPLMWTDPRMTLMEPKFAAEEVMRKQSPEELSQILQIMTD